MINNKKIYIWVGTSNPYNSIFIQVQMLAKLLDEILNVKAIILYPEIENVRTKIKNIISAKSILFWHYGGFDKYLLGLKKDNIIFVYHNITPAIFFWFSDPAVAIRSLIGSIQLLSIENKCRWITMSKYNKFELNRFGFKNVIICPNVIATSELKKAKKTNHISLLFVGRISPNKNCINLLKEVEKVTNNLSEPIEFTIIGSVKPSCRYGKYFIKIYHELLNHPLLKVDWKKEIDEYELRKIYQQSWLYISMSLHEGFGVPAVESIANGTPALYLECGGQESILENYGMINLNQKNSYADQMQNLILSENDRNALLNNQIEIVKRYFAPQINNTITEIYGNLLGANQL